MSRVVHFEIPVVDIERSIDFYQKVLGWNFQKWDGPELYYLVSTGSNDEPGINGGLLKKRDPRQPVVNTIQVENVDATISLVEKNGGKCCWPKTPVPGVGWLAYFTDPEGNTHGAMQFDSNAK
ncbi:MAG: VOC family protein [Acidobacteriales bacterium]|nr:VOC family protein [Terriglobales bacterium]